MEGFSVVGQAGNGIDAISLIKRLSPDLAVLDMSMPGANGLETFLEARRWSPDTRFALLTGNPSPALFTQATEAGIDGILVKNQPPEEICEAIASIAHGQKVFAGLAGETGTGTPELTAREIEVLQCLARGMSNAGTAGQLGISPKTVDSHRTNLMKKLEVHSTAALLVKAMKLGLLDV